MDDRLIDDEHRHTFFSWLSGLDLQIFENMVNLGIDRRRNYSNMSQKGGHPNLQSCVPDIIFKHVQLYIPFHHPRFLPRKLDVRQKAAISELFILFMGRNHLQQEPRFGSCCNAKESQSKQKPVKKPPISSHFQRLRLPLRLAGQLLGLTLVFSQRPLTRANALNKTLSSKKCQDERSRAEGLTPQILKNQRNVILYLLFQLDLAAEKTILL